MVVDTQPNSFIKYDPSEVAMEGVWKIVGFATVAILFWSYMKSRVKGE